MATRAERFKAAKERSGPKKPPSTNRKPKATDVESVDDGAGQPASRVRSSKNATEQAADVEDSAAGKPSKRSAKTTLQKRAIKKTQTPEAFAAKAKAKAKKTR